MVTRHLLLLIWCLFMLLLPFSALAAALPPARVVQDQLGRSVLLPHKVQRIIPLGGSARYVAYLQAFHLVVGVEAIEKRLAPSAGRPYNLAIRQQAKHLPVVAEGYQKPVNPEAILALRPDLIITAEADRPQADFLSRITGTPVLAINYGGMGVLKLENVTESLRLLGTVLSREKRAAQLIDYMKVQHHEFDRRIAGSTSPHVYIGAVSHRGSHGITSTDADYYPLQAIHTLNLAQQLSKQGHFSIDKEQLLVWNPSFILIDASGLGLVREDYTRHKDFYNRLAAVRNNQIYVTLPYNSYHTNLELALANSWYIARIVYPERFADSDPARKTDEICRMFVGIPCYKKLQEEFGGFGRLQLGNRTAHAN
jgi:iron complex transport system substrate-binding protein